MEGLLQSSPERKKSLETPLIIINFKAYAEALGERAIELMKACEEVSKSYGINITVAPQFTDLKVISEKFDVPVIAQHFDLVEAGAFTGHITPLAVKDAGAIGSLISHSEKRLSLENIGRAVRIARKYELLSIVCAHSLEEVKNIAKFDPDFIAFEDPELIGSGRAISKVKPESVREFVEVLSDLNSRVIPLCGAGITSGEDVKRALELGTKGIIVASGVVKAKNPKEVLIDFAKSI